MLIGLHGDVCHNLAPCPVGDKFTGCMFRLELVAILKSPPVNPLGL